MSLPLNRAPFGWVTISTAPPVASVTHWPNWAAFSEWKLVAG
jgi:hypothetical protein